MNKTKQLTTAAIIAALYTVLTYLTNLFGLANGVIQVRFSEMLTVLSNAAIVPFVLRYTYGAEGSLLYFAQRRFKITATNPF